MSTRPSFVIGIAGPSGSGKTTLALRLAAALGGSEAAAVLQHDAYYRDAVTDEQPDEGRNFDHPDAIETALCADHLALLKSGGHVLQPVYDFSTHRRSVETRLVRSAPVIIAEGIHVLTDNALRTLLDLSVYLDTPLDVCYARRLARDTAERGRSREAVRDQWEKSVLPMYKEFVLPCRAFADVIVAGTMEMDAYLDALVTRIPWDRTSLRQPG